MKKMKQILALALAIVLTAAVSVTGTMAYLNDTDEAVNVMTLGNVKIEQIEQERDENGKLVDFSQAKPAYPAVGPVEWADSMLNINGGEYKVFIPELKNVVDKIVTVKNTGKSDAYVRTIVAIEAPGYDPNDWIHINYNDNGVNISAPVTTKIDDNVDYVIFAFTYAEALAAGESSAPSLMQVFLDSEADNKYCAEFGESLEILVVSQAVQAQGFANAQVALDTAFGAITADNHPWTNTVLVQTNDPVELKDALTSGKDVILNTDIVEIGDAAFDGSNTSVELAGSGTGSYGYLAFQPGKNNDTSVSNLTVSGTGFVEVGHHGAGGGTYAVENLTVKEMTATLCVPNGSDLVTAAFSQYGTATLTDCVMTGTVSVDPAYTAYDAAFSNGTKTTINGGEYGSIYLWHQAHMTITNAKVTEIKSCAITTKNLGKLTIGAGAEVGTIILNPGSYPPALVIEAGATVGEIIYNGTTYTQAQWMAKNP